MPSSIYARMAHDSFFRMGYIYQLEGDLHSAAACYIRSIENKPTAEAHTFLGWVLSQMGDLDHAIEECKKALSLDPSFGYAWNDIGVYLTEKHEFDKAVPYLKRACKSKNYDNREFPYYNLARVYVQKEMLLNALKQLHMALKRNPRFTPAQILLERVERQIH